jgi:hypothetical protein
MAKIVLGIGSSHTPMLALTSEQWHHRAAVDYDNPALNLTDGRFMNYSTYLAEVGPRCADVISPEILKAKELACQAALNHLGAELEKVAPDLVIIIGDDQRELFTAANQPAIGIFHGDEIITSNRFGRAETPEWQRGLGQTYLMDRAHTLPASSTFALELIHGLIDRNFDVGACAEVENPQTAGFGHAFGFIIKRLFRERSIPVVPVLLNTYYGPNVPSAQRSYDFGRALADVINLSAADLRIAIIASGGLSHFIVDEELDKATLNSFETGDHAFLRSLPRAALNSGSSEILNWIALAGATQHLPFQWKQYQPLYRTDAGTGTGVGFVVLRH